MEDKDFKLIMDKVLTHSAYGAYSSGGSEHSYEISQIDDLLDEIEVPLKDNNGRALSISERVKVVTDALKKVKQDNLNKLIGKI